MSKMHAAESLLNDTSSRIKAVRGKFEIASLKVAELERESALLTARSEESAQGFGINLEQCRANRFQPSPRGSRSPRSPRSPRPLDVQMQSSQMLELPGDSYKVSQLISSPRSTTHTGFETTYNSTTGLGRDPQFRDLLDEELNQQQHPKTRGVFSDYLDASIKKNIKVFGSRTS